MARHQEVMITPPAALDLYRLLNEKFTLTEVARGRSVALIEDEQIVVADVSPLSEIRTDIERYAKQKSKKLFFVALEGIGEACHLHVWVDVGGSMQSVVAKSKKQLPPQMKPLFA